MTVKRERREFQLSERASVLVDRLAEAYGCNFSDAVEGLLLGTIDRRAARLASEGLSPSEIEYAKSIGVSL